MGDMIPQRPVQRYRDSEKRRKLDKILSAALLLRFSEYAFIFL
jgi:hypothetical protein